MNGNTNGPRRFRRYHAAHPDRANGSNGNGRESGGPNLFAFNLRGEASAEAAIPPEVQAAAEAIQSGMDMAMPALIQKLIEVALQEVVACVNPDNYPEGMGTPDVVQASFARLQALIGGKVQVVTTDGRTLAGEDAR